MYRLHKYLLHALTLVFCLCISNLSEAHDHVLKLQWRFIGSTPSIDYLNKMQVFFDGVPGSFSPVVQQSDVGEMFVYVPENTQKVKFVSYAYYDNQWELYNLENRYSFDADFEFTYREDVAMVLLDLDLEAKQVIGSIQNAAGEELNLEANRLLVANSVPFTVYWDFSRTKDVSKLPVRIMVYVDSDLICFSDPGKQEEGGTLVCHLPKGKHLVTVVNEYFEKGYWIENIKENGATQDALAEKQMEVQQAFSIEMKIGDTDELCSFHWK